MAERKAFQTNSHDFEIYLHPDGSLTIEATGDYGDTEMGWGSTSSTLNLDPVRVAELRAFLSPS